MGSIRLCRCSARWCASRTSSTAIITSTGWSSTWRGRPPELALCRGVAHFGGGIHDRPHDLVVAGAAAQIAGQPVAHFGFGRVRIALEQRLGGDQDSGRTETALQRDVLEKFL